MRASRPAVAAEPVIVVAAGTTCAAAVAAAGLPTTGPDAIVVVRGPDGALRDLSWAPDAGAGVTPVALSSPDGLAVLRHSAAHVLAQAVQDLHGQAKLGIGPPIEDGFYYDFDVPRPFQPDDLERIERRMKHIIRSGQRFRRRVFPSPEAARAELAGKEFAVSTNQVDLYTPRRFGLTYRDRDGAEKPVAVIHRAPLGSHERFVGYLTEHFGGAFPVWLAPEQIRVIPVVDEVLGYASQVRAVLAEAGLRADVDSSDGRLPGKVRAAVTRKIPLIVVVGQREAGQGAVTVRYRSGEEITMPLPEFTEQATDLVRTRSLAGAGHLADGGGAG